MHSHDCADIAGQITPAGSDGQILYGIQSVRVDHKVSVVLVDGGRLAPVAIVEEFRERLALNAVDRIHVEPSAVAGQHNRVRLRDEMLASSVLGAFLGLRFGTLALGGTVSPLLSLAFFGLALGLSHLFILSRGCSRLRSRAVGRIEGVVRRSSRGRRGAILLDHRLCCVALAHLDIYWGWSR